MVKNLFHIIWVKIFGKNYDLKVVYSNIDTPELNIEENYEIKIIAFL